MDFYGGTYVVFALAILEITGIAWIYGKTAKIAHKKKLIKLSFQISSFRITEFLR